MLKPMIIAILACLALMCRPVQAQTVEEFYRGKRLTLAVGYGPGGAYDVFARLLPRHLGRFLPGNPAIIVQNMPGAGSLIAANYLYTIAPKDGTAFGLIARDMPLLGLMGHNPNVQFDPRKFTWLGSSSDFSDDAYVLIARTDAPAQSIADMRRSGGPVMVLGGTAGRATCGGGARVL